MMMSPRLSTVLAVLCLVAGCQCGGGEVPTVPEKVVGHCTYTNRFSGLQECRDYVGEWTDEAAMEDCEDQESTAVLGSACDLKERLGYCFLGGENERWTRISFPGVDAQKCGSMQRGCVLLGGGVFDPAPACGGAGSGQRRWDGAAHVPAAGAHLCRAQAGRAPPANPRTRRCARGR